MTVEEIIAGLDLTEEQIAKLTRNLAIVEGTRLQGLAQDVARAEEGSLMTRKGFDVLAKGIAGKQIKYTRVVIGDSMRNGQLVELTDAEIVELTAMINPVQEIPIVECNFAGNGTVVVRAVLQNTDFANGLHCRELGLFAEDPDTHKEVLYSYRNSGILSGYVPSGQGAVLVNLLLNLVTVVDNAQNITAVIDASLLYVSQTQLLEHINSATPHPNITQLIEDRTAQIVADEEARLKKVTNRLDQVETNVGNLFMQLGAADANLLIFTDFQDVQSVDVLKVKVLAATNGTNNISVESLEGIQSGIYYTLSDGVRSQYLRSAATASNDDLYTVTFDDPINKNFKLAKTYLYRSTAIIDEGRAGGSSKEQELTFAPDDIFSGVASSTTKTITLSTTQKNAANFDLQGDGAFNSNGFFTLS